MGDAIAETTSGKVRGILLNSIYSFKGIPYGGPTDGPGRLMPPTRPEPWLGVRDALDYGPSCPQPTEAVLNVTPEIIEIFEPAAPLAQSENCLVLNVWTPGLADGGRRPVLFWCHGGGFFVGSGSDPWVEGSALCRRGDVVVVTVNHRLGPLGFLHLADLAGERYAASGNAGMLDLVAALEWVRDNIQAFGGDPGNVTIFGESGGGAKVSMLMAMPAAQGLFHKAIIQSGPGLHMHSRERATKNARTFLRRLKVSPGNIQDLHDVPVERFLAAQAAASRINPFFMLEPVVDGEILPHPPFEPSAPEISVGIPLLIGTTRDEATLFMGNIPLLGTFSRDAVLSMPALRLLMRVITGRAAPRIIAAYRHVYPGASPRELCSRIASDWVMRLATIRLAERKLAGGTAPVFLYRFDWATPVKGGRLGAHHALEIPFVFDNLHQAPALVDNGPQTQALAAAMSDAWLAFARTGEPGHSALPHWPAYSLEERPTMIFDTPCRLELDPGREERLAWQGVKELQIM
jgi:para-nitrobenzyl esterase